MLRVYFCCTIVCKITVWLQSQISFKDFFLLFSPSIMIGQIIIGRKQSGRVIGGGAGSGKVLDLGFVLGMPVVPTRLSSLTKLGIKINKYIYIFLFLFQVWTVYIHIYIYKEPITMWQVSSVYEWAFWQCRDVVKGSFFDSNWEINWKFCCIQVRNWLKVV